MRFDTSQHMKLGQQMKLAPRMIQSMEILQMPLAELEERIEQELSSNPTLELVEPEYDDSQRKADRDDAPDRGLEIDSEKGEADFARLDEYEQSNPEAAENAFDEEFKNGSSSLDRFEDRTRVNTRLAGEPDAKAEAMSQTPARSGSLQEQLLAQWGVVDVQESLRPIGVVLIGHLDEDGYLRTPLEEVIDKSTWHDGSAPDLETLEVALSAVQLLLEPTGVAARDARECLLLQIDAQLDRLAEAAWNGDEADGVVATGDALGAARRIVDGHLEDLMKNRLPKISEATELDLDEIKAALEALRRLSLAPGRRLVEERIEPILPDAVVEFDEANDRYIAYLTDSRLGVLQLNREYALMAKDRGIDKRDRDFLKTNLSNAQWLMDAVEQRRGTLLRVINAVLEEQRDFFDYGPDALKPLPMTGVAERLGVHVATVSRAVADKHLMTPRGVVPLRSFFTGGLQTESGEEVSSNAIKAALQDLVDGEDKKKPLSDEALAKALKERGFEVARRTVAKYRGQMNMPSARMRKTF